MTKNIMLNKLFEKNLFTRNSIIHLFEKINHQKEKNISVDFKNIDFISRSCADEYFKQKNKSKKTISEKNIHKNVCSMFENVENQYKSLGISNQPIFLCPKKDLILTN